jgi:hemoglobin-like flavoprotein
MEDAQVTLINESFAAVSDADAFAKTFYFKLFALEPSVRPLFSSDMQAQGKKLMHLVGVAVANARHPDRIRGAVDQLAIRHVRYGVKMEHFATVGTALLSTFEETLGPRFNSATKGAWAALYGELVAIMAPHFSEPAPKIGLAASPASAPPARTFFQRLAFWR